SGVPVLGSIYSQAVDELVRDGENGWLIDPLDPGDLAAGLARALSTGRTGLERMRAAARSSAGAVRHQDVADRFAESLRRAASGRGQAPNLRPPAEGVDLIHSHPDRT
ncbi:MAG: glycosyltransferase, partial [Longimicrobiales bacterium]